MARGLQQSFIGCDWGTTGFRLALVKNNGGISIHPVQPTYRPAGIADSFARWQQGGESNRESWFIKELEKAIDSIEFDAPDSIKDFPVVISGMASSSIGMKELPYAKVPFNLSGLNAITEHLRSASGRQVTLISGARTENDVIRGEETQLIGLAYALGEMELRDKTVILPGTHSKHLSVSEAGLDGIRTFMTGELFSLISTQSVLRHSVSFPAPPLESVITPLSEGLKEGFGGTLTAQLFRIRVDQLSDRFSAGERSGFLLGLLLGDELKALANSSAEIILCSGGSQAEYYRFALEKYFPGRYRLVPEQTADEVAFLGQACILENHLQ